MEPRERLADLYDERYRLQRIKSETESRLKTVDGEIMELMLGALGEEKFATDRYKGSIVTSHNSVIARDLLVLEGVSGEVIDRCTKRTPYSYVKVSENKADNAEGGRA